MLMTAMELCLLGRRLAWPGMADYPVQFCRNLFLTEIALPLQFRFAQCKHLHFYSSRLFSKKSVPNAVSVGFSD